jgi:hypothetical protein
MGAGKIWLSGLAALSLFAPAVGQDAPRAERVEFARERGAVRITAGGRPFARYVYQDPVIRRPYFCDVREPGGAQVTRVHPPVPGRDATDHADMHPGIWLGFGDLSGADFWRNKGRVEHVRFVGEPRNGAGEGGFTVERRYVAPDGRAMALETCRYTVAARPHGRLLVSDSAFVPAGELVFGDQEEMGFGLRVATGLTVTAGGRILDADGRRNEKEVRASRAAWADYSGTIEGRAAGLCLMPDPANFRRAWYHARDYGLLVANPFGRNALTGGEPSRVVVKPGERLRLRFGVLVHGGAAPDLPAAYQDFLSRLEK